MPTNPAISVIVPIYNSESFIQETIDSILSQTFTDFELLCINDGSTDSTQAVLEETARVDTRIKLFLQDNSGPGAARNLGLDKARGQYVIMLDSDDLYDETMLESLYKQALTTHADVVVCEASQFEGTPNKATKTPWTLKIEQIPNKPTFSYRDMPDFLFTAFMGWPWDKLYRRSFIEKERLRFPILSNSEDLYFVYLSLAKANSIAIVEKPLVRHRVNRKGSVSTSRANDPLAFYRSICLLKQQLKEQELYSSISWSFLNWALEYTVWNIETMSDGKAQASQIEKLKAGELQELELAIHSPAFYSLNPTVYWRYKRLVTHACNPSVKQIGPAVIMPRLLTAIRSAQSDGTAQTLLLLLKKLGSKLVPALRSQAEKPKNRGSAFAATTRCAAIDRKSR